MGSSFRPCLVNDLFGDPALYVRLPWARRALLFDLGDLEVPVESELASRQVSLQYVTHGGSEQHSTSVVNPVQRE